MNRTSSHITDTRPVLTRLLAALGMTPAEFELERAKFDLSPSEWLTKRLRAMGWK